MTKKTTKPKGRPTKYCQKLADSICSIIAQGNSMRKVCSKKSMPSIQTVFTWFRKYPDFLDQYTRAKTESADSDQDKLDEIAEKVLTGKYEPPAARVAADIIKWSMGKKKPKKYGDKIVNEHTGAINFTNLTDDELKAKKKEVEQALKQSTQD